MNAILALLRSLWPWARRRATPVAEAPAPAATEAPLAPAPIPPEPEPPLQPEPSPGPEPRADPLLALVEDGDVEEEMEEDSEDDYDDPSQPDPFITDEAPLLETEVVDDLDRRREAALALALSGEHRIFLTDKAGPGSLAEALNRLLKERRVTAEFRDDDEGGGFILYRPETL